MTEIEKYMIPLVLLLSLSTIALIIYTLGLDYKITNLKTEINKQRIEHSCEVVKIDLERLKR